MKRIKSLLIIVLFNLSVISIFGQAPEKITYQAVIRDSSGHLVTNHLVGIQISILEGSINGNALYVETHQIMTNSNGLVTFDIGSGTLVHGSFSAIQWESGTYFIKSETDISGGTNYSISGSRQLLSVPYALHANTASEITGVLNETDPVYSSSIAAGIGTSDIMSWNNKLDTFIETDPVFTNSVAAGITNADTVRWNNKLSSYTESDPLFTISVAHGITQSDTIRWNQKSDFDGQYTSLTGSPVNVSYFNNDAGYLTVENDDSDTNELQQLSMHNDTISLNLGGGYVVLPKGDQPGDMRYWNGTMWVNIPAGQPGQYLQIGTTGVPQWSGAGYATITTDSLSSITPVSAVVDATIASNGGGAITSRGICYDTLPNPTLANDFVTGGTGIGSFSCQLTQLATATTYYVRAFATNSAGTVYANELVFMTDTSWTIGTTGPAGGLVYYDKGYYSDGWRYLEAAPIDQSSGTDWGCSGTLIPGSLNSAIGSGYNNTQAIIANCISSNIAARKTTDYSLNGFSDWFLPSRQELDLMYQNLHNSGKGSFNNISTYWSSTQNNSISAQGTSFSSGGTIHNNKTVIYRVRAARRF